MKTLFENENLIIFHTGYDKQTGGSYWEYDKKEQTMTKYKNVDCATEDAMAYEQSDNRAAEMKKQAIESVKEDIKDYFKGYLDLKKTNYNGEQKELIVQCVVNIVRASDSDDFDRILWEYAERVIGLK